MSLYRKTFLWKSLPKAEVRLAGWMNSVESKSFWTGVIEGTVIGDGIRGKDGSDRSGRVWSSA